MRILMVLLGTGVAGLAQTNTADYPVSKPDSGATNLSATAPANTPGPKVRQLSLQDCVQMALQHNLDLQIDRYTPQIAQFDLRGAYGGYDPVLSLSGDHGQSDSNPTLLGTTLIPGQKTDNNAFNAGISGSGSDGNALLPWGMTYGLQGNVGEAYGAGFDQTGGSASLSVRQHLLQNFWNDTTRLTIRIKKNRLSYSELGLKWQIIQTITKLEEAYYDLIYNRENVIVQQKAVELAERLVAENKKKLEVGAMAPLDLESAESQAAQNRASLIKAQSQLATQERLVKQLMTDNFAAWADVILEPSGKLEASHQVFNRQDSWRKGLTQRPDLLQAKLDVEKQGIQLKYDRNQLFPALDLVGTYGYNGSGKEFSDALYDIEQRNRRFFTYGGQLTIPLSNISARNTVKSSKATLQQMVLTLKKAEQDIMVSLDNDIGTVQANYEQVLATRAARQYAESALNAEEMKLQNGKSTVYTVLQMQRDLTTDRGTEIQALDTFNQSISTLSQDEGSTLERLRIDWQAK